MDQTTVRPLGQVCRNRLTSCIVMKYVWPSELSPLETSRTFRLPMERLLHQADGEFKDP